MVIKFIGVICLLGLTTSLGLADSTDTAMYFNSHVRDSPECTASINSEGKVIYPATISNPAATCPDTYSWATFLGTIKARFWDQWGNDETVWIDTPKPACSSAEDTDCCFVEPNGAQQVGYRNSAGETVKPHNIGGFGNYCPYIPGDWGGAIETTFAGGKPGNSHNSTFLRTLDPGRVARQGQVEVVYRNDSFIRYTTQHELYSKTGLSKLFARIAGEAKFAKPHRPSGQGISYPTSAVMFKVAWIDVETMIELGYISDHDNDPTTPEQNSRYPYITQKIRASDDDGKTYKEDLYYLVSIAASTKALPNWHWFAFEHVGNLGRCDYIGCNDSFGVLNPSTVHIASPDDPEKKIEISFNSNFISPHTQDDALNDDKSIFVLGKRYESGQISASLAKLFNEAGIGNGNAPVDPEHPKITDIAWKSYRLKGTQTQFVNNDGTSTLLGSSINEGGFVNSASCISCHAQASVNANGEIGVPGVGSTGRLNIFGIDTAISGPPVTADYYNRGTTRQLAVQTDFVWGILFAQDTKNK